jgi:hypothetical protein
MARYRVQGPDGKIHVFEGPDGASPADVEAFAAQTFGGKKKEAPPIAGGIDPSEGGGTLNVAGFDTGIKTPQWLDRTLSGVGAGMSSVGRALTFQGGKEEAERLNKPLMDTTAGTVGNAIGIAAPAALAVPFTPATFAGAAVAGGATGAAMTEGGVLDRLQGGGLGAVGGLAGQALPYVYRAGKGVIKGIAEPFMAGGRDRIAGRAIERFAANPNALQNIATGPSITGARPLLSEATGDTGLATLERAIGTLDPEAAAMLAERSAQNNAARLESLRAVAGGATQPVSRLRRLNAIATGQPTREAAEATRSAAANASYGAARGAGVDQPMSEALAPQIASLLERPSIQNAVNQARALAREEGIELTDMGSVQGLQYIKQAIDDARGALGHGERNRMRLLTQTSSDLKSVLDEIAPALRSADAEFAMNSVPVNRAAVGERLMERTTGAIRDFSGNRRLQANAFSRALNDEEALIRQSGARGASLDDFLTPSQSQRVGAVRNELETIANLSSAANGPGSQTAKMLASQNLLRQIAGPLGLPEGFVTNALSQTALRPVQWGLQAAEPRIQAAIANGLLNPEDALRLVQAARAYDVQLPPNALQLLLRRSAPAAIGASAAYGSGQ